MSETLGNFMGRRGQVRRSRDRRGQPDLEEGELWLRGHGLMHGYYKKEREEVFDENGWFHTGDRVFMHEGRPVLRRAVHRDGEVAGRERRAA